MPSTNESHVISLIDIHVAQQRIAGHVLVTPAIHCELISKKLGCELWLKAENLQHIGAFKARGAVNAVMSLTDDQASRGVVTHSSGNHAAALARAARIRGIPAFVVMPENSSPKKIAAVRSFGVDPVLSGPSTQEREQAAAELQHRTGAVMIHPFETPEVIAGQGTVGIEILDQVQGLDAVFVPVGGGGLLSGVLVAIKSIRPEVKVIAVEPKLADDTARSLRAGRPQPPTRYDTVADGLRTQVGDNTFPIIQELVDDMVLVDEAEILSAMRWIAEAAHLVAEPSGAVALAGLVAHSERYRGSTVAAVISGGNLSFADCRMGTA